MDVDLAIERAVRIHPDAGSVQLERGGSLDWDYLVIATGARLVPDQIPGLAEGAFGFYSLEDAERLREELGRFRGGRVKVGVAGIPYKCPPAPVEFVFMLEEFLRRTRFARAQRDHAAFPAEPGVHDRERVEADPADHATSAGSGSTTFFNVESVDAVGRGRESLEGEKAEYDLLVLVPPARGQEVDRRPPVSATREGGSPTDRHTLQVDGHERIFAIGRRDGPADLEERVDRALRGTRGREPDRIAGATARRRRRTTAAGSCASSRPATARRRSLRFDYEHPPAPPSRSAMWHTAKWLFNRLYWDVRCRQATRSPSGRSRGEEGVTMSATIATTLDMKGSPARCRSRRRHRRSGSSPSGDLIEALATDPGVGPRFQCVVHARPATSSSSERKKTACSDS